MSPEFGPEGIEAIKFEQKERARATLRSFIEFVYRQRSQIASFAGDKQKLADFYRQNFLITPEKDKYRGLIVDKTIVLAEQGEKLIRANKNPDLIYGQIFPEMNKLIPNGIVCYGNGGSTAIPTDSALGRIYVNLVPSQALAGFKAITESLQRVGIPFQVKAFYMGVPYELNRTDKCVIYFGENAEANVLRVVENIEPKYLDSTGVPKLASPLKNSKGVIMPGVSFGQEPYQAKESFNGIRADLLADLYTSFEGNLDKVNEEDLWLRFEKLCLQYKVDPNWPAFNSGVEGKFPIIRGRCARQSVEDFTQPVDPSLIREGHYKVGKPVRVTLGPKKTPRRDFFINALKASGVGATMAVGYKYLTSIPDGSSHIEGLKKETQPPTKPPTKFPVKNKKPGLVKRKKK